MTDDARDCEQPSESKAVYDSGASARLRLAKWLAYARSRNPAKPAEILATKPATEPSAVGWWKRWTRNLDALEARLSPGAGKQRKAFRKKQSAKAVLERDARRNQKRGEDAPDLE